MRWDRNRAEARIRKHLTTVPSVEDGISLAKHIAAVKEARARGDLARLSTRRTFLVEGAHMYGQLLDFEDLVTENGRETKQSHGRLLQFLHAYYRVWDAIVDGESCHRVDYHGARMHAVTSDSSGNARAQVERTIALASKLSHAAEQIGLAFGIHVRVRFGIDHGRCLAMTTGRSHERDTLLLGSPANHAAKKAAEEAKPGIFLAVGAQRVLEARAFTKSIFGTQLLADSYIQDASSRYRFDSIDRATTQVIREKQKQVDGLVFRFHRHSPPLVTLKFAELTPAQSVRNDIACIFADIDGFTAYVDDAIRSGPTEIKAAVRTVHVIREELNDVLQDDFEGKRIRFIGDCIHGTIAAGDSKTDDASEAVFQAVMCSAAMGSSFDLCLNIAEPGAELDLAVGIEYGPVPITRLGNPGDESVRCAVSRAVVHAEHLQQSLEGGGVVMGPIALSHSSLAMKKAFGNATRILRYPSAADLLGAATSPAIQILRENPAARPHTDARC